MEVKRTKLEESLKLGKKMTLRDDSSVVIRFIKLEDKNKIKQAFTNLSNKSRFLRFLTPMIRLSSYQLNYITGVNQYDHVAIIALDSLEQEANIIGGAQYVKLANNLVVAEVAATVVDSYHGLGLGTLLLSLLVDLAQKNDIEYFRAYIHPENKRVLDMARKLGSEIKREDGILCTDFSIKMNDLPDIIHRVLKEIVEKD